MHLSTIYGLIIHTHDDQLPIGLKAQLPGHCMALQRSGFKPPSGLKTFVTAEVAYVTVKIINIDIVNNIKTLIIIIKMQSTTVLVSTPLLSVGHDPYRVDRLLGRKW